MVACCPVDGLRAGAAALSPTRGQEEEEEEEEDEFGGQETLVTAPPQHAEHEFTQDNTMVIREDLQPGASPLSGVGMGSPSSSFMGQNPYLARMSAESQRRSFAYIPPDVAGRGSQPTVQTRPHEEQRRGGENGGVPRGGQATEGPKMSPEIRKYKRKFNGEILCGALWGVNLLVGTDNGLLLLDRSGHGKGMLLCWAVCASQMDSSTGWCSLLITLSLPQYSH